MHKQVASDLPFHYIEDIQLGPYIAFKYKTKVTLYMITNKIELKEYIRNDRERNLGKNVSAIKYWLLLLYGADRAKSYRYLKALRKYEWSITQKGNHSNINFYYLIVWAFRKLRYNRLCIKYNIVIKPNVVGQGLYLPHLVGGGIIINCNSMGCDCRVNVGVVVGNKKKDDLAVIGNGVDLATGCKVIGNVVIGDNVTVAPNAVVVKDVPDNAIVGGVPAKIIKFKV